MKVGITLPVFCWLSNVYTLFCDCHTSPLGTIFVDCIVLQHDWKYWTVIECHLILINMHVVICHLSHHWHFVIYVTVSLISTHSCKFSNLSPVYQLIKYAHNHQQEIVIIKIMGLIFLIPSCFNITKRKLLNLIYNCNIFVLSLF